MLILRLFYNVLSSTYLKPIWGTPINIKTVDVADAKSKQNIWKTMKMWCTNAGVLAQCWYYTGFKDKYLKSEDGCLRAIGVLKNHRYGKCRNYTKNRWNWTKMCYADANCWYFIDFVTFSRFKCVCGCVCFNCTRARTPQTCQTPRGQLPQDAVSRGLGREQPQLVAIAPWKSDMFVAFSWPPGT